MRAKIWWLVCAVSMLLVPANVTVRTDGVIESRVDDRGSSGRSCLRRTFDRKLLVTVGDSIGYGFQIESFRAVAGGPFVPDEVFPGVEAAILDRLRRRGIKVGSINFSCPGQASQDFVTGPCQFHANGFPLHDGLDYQGAQLEAVAQFLEDHGKKVGAIGMWLGGNDVFRLVNACLQTNSADPVGCVRTGRPAMIAKAIQNWTTALSRLQGLAPRAVFIAHLYFDPTSILNWPDGTATFAEYNVAIGSLLRAHGVRTIDLDPVFNRSPRTLCRLTGLCNPVVDVHPSDAGQRVIAKLDLLEVENACATK